MKPFVVSFLLALVCLSPVVADEGMWRPEQLPELSEALKELGLEIDPANLSDLLDHPMNAVISLGGCTASFVSPDGLAVTNHHCVYGALQFNSTQEENLMEEGFMAAERSGERPAGPGSRILVTVDVTDVTGRIRAAIPEAADGLARFEAIDGERKALVSECEKDNGHRCAVRTYHGGLEYELIKQLEIQDVRLVYAPKAAIGIYGGEVDNWMWPRHTGDFAFYRAYVSPNGKPAEYSEENVPFHPAHHLEISTEGLSNTDFVMVAGYPGTTNRYRLAAEVESQFEWDYPTRKRIFEEWRQIVTDAAPEGSDAAIKYGSLLRGLDNATKNYGGMIDGYARTDVLDSKRKLEAGLRTWIESDPERSAEYLPALEEMANLVAQSVSRRERDFYYGYLARRGELARTAKSLYRLSLESQKPDMERESGYQERDLGRFTERMNRLERTLDLGVDRTYWKKFLLYYLATPVAQHEPALDGWFGIDGAKVDEAAVDAKLEEMYSGTRLGDTAERLGWMERSPEEFQESDDPFIRFAVLQHAAEERLEEETKRLQGLYDAARPSYMAAVIAYLESLGRPIYPDANSTLRITYGTVKGYSPRDAVNYTPFTSLEGLAEKHTGEEPFDATQAQLDLIGEEAYGDYLDESIGSVPVNFLSTVDTTGGNSGSPTLDSKARLVGLLFDGNWESIISGWSFNHVQTRSIHVDIRYALWVMEHLDDAGHLLEEMGVGRSTHRREASK